MKLACNLITAILLSSVCVTAVAQKSGQSMQIQYGKVVSATYVQEKSDAGKAALLGGAIGYGLTRNRSTSTKLLATAAGAGIAGGAKKKSEGSREAREYEVVTNSGVVVIISDQTEIQIGDCVVVENPGNTNANIRRMDPVFCEPESAEVVAELQEELIEEAEECASSKRELAAAETDEAFDRAMRKVEILCNM
jgi:hypothetical protein